MQRQRNHRTFQYAFCLMRMWMRRIKQCYSSFMQTCYNGPTHVEKVLLCSGKQHPYFLQYFWFSGSISNQWHHIQFNLVFFNTKVIWWHWTCRASPDQSLLLLINTFNENPTFPLWSTLQHFALMSKIKIIVNPNIQDLQRIRIFSITATIWINQHKNINKKFKTKKSDISVVQMWLISLCICIKATVVRTAETSGTLDHCRSLFINFNLLPTFLICFLSVVGHNKSTSCTTKKNSSYEKNTAGFCCSGNG